jgi:hypothetical protein
MTLNYRSSSSAVFDSQRVRGWVGGGDGPVRLERQFLVKKALLYVVAVYN